VPYKVEGSPDGKTWTLFAIKGDEATAREAACSAVRKTKHRYVRIVEA